VDPFNISPIALDDLSCSVKSPWLIRQTGNKRELGPDKSSFQIRLIPKPPNFYPLYLILYLIRFLYLLLLNYKHPRLKAY